MDLRKLKKLGEASGIRIFFWNVAWGSFNQDSDLDKNLMALVASNASPDMIILAEFKTSNLNDPTREFLTRMYPHRYFIRLDESELTGIAVLSKTPFQRCQAPQYVDWAPFAWDEQAKEGYRFLWKDGFFNHARYWDRGYCPLEWPVAGGTLHVVPTHLLSPWAAIHDRYGKLEAVKQAQLSDYRNPLYNQVQHYRELLRRDFGPKLNSKPLLMIGDFNAPSSIYILTPSLYTELSRHLSALVTDPINRTFPSVSSGTKVPHIFGDDYGAKIDNAFGNEHVKGIGQAILHFKGSDHYPIYVMLKLDN